MIWFLAFIYFLYMVLIFLSRKEERNDKRSFLDGLFEKMAKWLSKKPLLGNLRSYRVKENLNMLHPAKDVQEMVDDFYIKKIKMVLVLLLAGTVAVTFAKIYALKNPQILSDFSIQRNRKGQGEKVVDATAYLTREEEVKREPVRVVVSEQAYTREEIRSFFEEMETALEAEILMENESLDKVMSKLGLFTAYGENPVQVTWSSSDYGLVDEDGTVFNEELTSPETVILTAQLKYGEETEEVELPIIVYPREYAPQESLKMNLYKSIEEENEKGAATEQMRLPQNVDGYEVYYVEKSQGSEGLLWILFLVVSILLYWNEDARLQTQVEQRKKALVLAYPEFVSKLTLLTHAGMTIRGAIGKILMLYEKEEGKGKRNPCYEELRIALYEMENGVYEEKAYENLGKRVKLPSYVKLSGLLSQNVKKGSKDLLIHLEREAEDAFEERKRMARRLGEEAGTKLLLPMMLMLLVVLILIMVPAFLSYQM